MKNLGQAIKHYRTLKRWSRTQLADASDLSPNMIAHYENGQSKAQIINVIKIAQAMDITLQDLVSAGTWHVPADCFCKVWTVDGRVMVGAWGQNSFNCIDVNGMVEMLPLQKIISWRVI